MTNKKVTRRALLMSVTSLLICISMLLGTTFAWFTDEVTSGVNQIVAGNLDVELEHNSGSGNESVSGQTKLFNSAAAGHLWEPGAMAYETFTVKNVGSLALKYKLSLVEAGKNFVVDANTTTATTRSLLDVLRVGIVTDTLGTSRDAIANQVTNWTTLGEYIASTNQSGTLYPTGYTGQGDVGSKTFTVVLYWPSDTEAISALSGTALKDNDYNLKNGAYASDATALTVGQLYVNLGVTLVATQVEHEADSFDNKYDKTSEYPTAGGFTSSATETYKAAGTTITIPGVAETKVAAATTLKYTDGTEKTVTDDADLKLTVEETETPANFQVTTGDSTTSYEVTLETVTTSGSFKVSSADNAIITDLYIGIVDLAKFAHNGIDMSQVASKAEVDTDGDYYYDVNTGYITMATTTFSPFTAEYKFAGGLGTEQYPYLIENREQFEAIDENSANYAYYKWNGASTMDCSGWTNLILNGSFDGNGVTFKNLDSYLFYGIEMESSASSTVKNFIIENCSVIKDRYYVAPVIDWIDPCETVNLSNIVISGYAESTVISSFIGWSEAKTMNIDNCVSTLTLVSTGSQVSGFVGNAAGTCYINVTDSIFDGSMACTANSGQYLFAHNNSNAQLKLSYTDSFTATHSDLWPSFVNTGAQNNPYNSTNGTYSKINKGTLTAPENTGDSITVEKDENAVKAVATFIVGVNPGNFTRIFHTDVIDLTTAGDTFNTITVKKYNVQIVTDGSRGTGLEGDTQIISDVGSDGTYHCIIAHVVQYAADGSITSVRECSLA